MHIYMPCLCVVYACALPCICVDAYRNWRLPSSIFHYHFLPSLFIYLWFYFYLFWDKVSHWPRPHQVVQTGYLASSVDPPVFTSPTYPGYHVWICTWVLRTELEFWWSSTLLSNHLTSSLLIFWTTETTTLSYPLQMLRRQKEPDWIVTLNMSSY